LNIHVWGSGGQIDGHLRSSWKCGPWQMGTSSGFVAPLDNKK
jgi:hypothetical protein